MAEVYILEHRPPGGVTVDVMWGGGIKIKGGRTRKKEDS
jgi:hypothetical protein